jgi:hypothetical protein
LECGQLADLHLDQINEPHIKRFKNPDSGILFGEELNNGERYPEHVSKMKYVQPNKMISSKMRQYASEAGKVEAGNWGGRAEPAEFYSAVGPFKNLFSKITLDS